MRGAPRRPGSATLPSHPRPRLRLVLSEDLIAQPDALGADVHARPGDQPQPGAAAFPRNEHEVLTLDHYLEVLRYKPGALPGATALAQARSAGAFTAISGTGTPPAAPAAMPTAPGR
jgi:hypothetical protein